MRFIYLSFHFQNYVICRYKSQSFVKFSYSFLKLLQFC
ncbi:hypothetical protein X975_19482, partial [Stegodyphus mimosarum]